RRLALRAQRDEEAGDLGLRGLAGDDHGHRPAGLVAREVMAVEEPGERLLEHASAESKTVAPSSGGYPDAKTTRSSVPWLAVCSGVPAATCTTPPAETSMRSGGSPRYIVSAPLRTTKVSSCSACTCRRPFAPGS